MEFYSPQNIGTAEITEKRSRFIGYAAPAAEEKSAAETVADIKTRHRDARHNAWCWILPDGTERVSDDGEPQGTAGVPVLEMLRRENIRGIVVVVTRYFGGVLLGTGGLVRAYTAAAKNAVAESGLVLFTVKRRVLMRVSYQLLAKVKAEIVSCGGFIEKTAYTESVELFAVIGADSVNTLFERIRNATSNTVETHDLGDITVPL